MRARRKLFLVLLMLCGYWLGAATPLRALPLQGIMHDLAVPDQSSAPAKARKPLRKTARTKKPRKRSIAQRAPQTAISVPLPTQPPLPPNLKLQAALGPAGPALTEGIGWRVLAEKPEAGKAEKVVWSGGGAEPNIHLDPGHYYVEAAFGFARNGREIEIPPDNALQTKVVLNAGTIHARGVAFAGGPPLNDMFYVLHRTDATGAPTGEIGRSGLPQATFHVPAGAYRLALQHDLAKTEIPVTVAAGQEVQAEGVLNAGHLKLTAVAAQGGPILDDAVFFVYADTTSGQPQEVARSQLRQPEFSLPAGRYRIVAQWGLARVERQVTVKPGAPMDETLVLDAGVVKLSSVLAGSNQPLDRQLIYKVYALAGDQGAPAQPIATLPTPAPTLYLKSGKYRIESQYGWHNARQAREVDIGAGDTTDLLFEHRACEVKLQLAIAPGTPAPGKVKWTVKYANGGTVLISQDDAPALILQAGSYQAVAQYGNKTYSRAFEAVPNEVHTIELVVE